MTQKGLIPIQIILIVVVILILAVGAIYLFISGDSSATIIQPKPQKSLKSTTVTPSNQKEIRVPGINGAEPVKPEVKPEPAVQTSVIDENGSVTYTNETFKFSVDHPQGYIFEEKIRNYYNVETTTDANELVYTYTLSNPQLAPTGGIPGDKILVTVYQQGYQPYILNDNKDEITKTVGGIETKMIYGKDGKLITVGPITHQDNIFTIQYEIPNTAASNQPFFEAVLESFKFTE